MSHRRQENWPSDAARRERTKDGELVVREGLPEKWHYTVQLSKLETGVYGKIVVMYDGILKVNLWVPNIGLDEEDGVRRARERVLGWIADYNTRQRK